MSVLDGPGEGTWSVFAAKVMEERDDARRERDEALAKYQFMVDRAADEKLDGYRELASRLAAAENERDLWERRARAAVASMDVRPHAPGCVSSGFSTPASPAVRTNRSFPRCWASAAQAKRTT